MENVHSLFNRVRRIELRTRKLVAQLVCGDYSSIFRGHGMEFSDLRPYVEGDDPKRIDWNVYARTRAPFVKVFTEERELTVLLIVDLSGSLRFGSLNLTKAERVAEVDALDNWQQAVMGVCMVSNDRSYLDKQYSLVEAMVLEYTELQLINMTREWL